VATDEANRHPASRPDLQDAAIDLEWLLERFNDHIGLRHGEVRIRVPQNQSARQDAVITCGCDERLG
jgi:hypothetical protein